MSSKQIKVLIVDDSAFIRVLLTQIFQSDDEISVVGTAEDPYDAREKIKKYSPDVITLDVEMPKMDGITFLKNLMRLRPMPVVMVSTLTQAGADITLQALGIGAFDFVAKPTSDVKESIKQLSQELIGKVKAAAKCNIHAVEKNIVSADSKLTVDNKKITTDLIAIGSSTGGTEALQAVLKPLPTNLPPIVMAQHIPDLFSSSYAKRLNREVSMKVMEVRGPQLLEPGNAYLAPGHMHMKIKQKDNELWGFLSDDEPVNRHKPAVDVLFNSIPEPLRKRCVAFILTGMGQDGAKGLLNLKQSGTKTFVQDEATSIVWGMPGAAYKLGAADDVLPLTDIPKYLISKL
jgi:two-component system chemotaxis response regulator CheB